MCDQMGFILVMQTCFKICKSINVIHHINRRKGKNHTSKDTFDTIQYLFMIKTLSNSHINGMYLNMIKVVYDKPIVGIILNGEKLKAFPPKSRMLYQSD